MCQHAKNLTLPLHSTLLHFCFPIVEFIDNSYRMQKPSGTKMVWTKLQKAINLFVTESVHYTFLNACLARVSDKSYLSNSNMDKVIVRRIRKIIST